MLVKVRELSFILLSTLVSFCEIRMKLRTFFCLPVCQCFLVQLPGSENLGRETLWRHPKKRDSRELIREKLDFRAATKIIELILINPV